MEKRKMFSIYKKLSCLIALFVTASVFAQDYSDKESSNQAVQKPYDQGHAVTENQMMAGYNAPARIDVCGSWDIFVDGSFIYWQAKEKGLELGYLSPSAANITAGHTGNVINMDFDYKPGFKVGLGMNFEHDNWNVYADYTRLHGTNTKSYAKANAADSFVQGWMADGTDTYNTNFSTHWKLNYDMIDFELGRPFYNGKKLTVKPFFGVRGGWIKQQYSPVLTYDTGSTINYPTAGAGTRSWLVGPRAGFNTNWLLGKGFRFFGDFSASLLYQRFKLKYHYTSYADYTTPAARFKDKFSYITPNINFFAGFGWGTYFDHNNWHFDVLAGYEFENYWNQNYMRNMADRVLVTGCPDTDAGDLSLSGLTVKMRFDF